MNRILRYSRVGSAALVGLILLAISQSVAAEQAKPQASSGLSVDSLDLLPLAAQIPAMAGYALRIRQGMSRSKLIITTN